MFAGEAAAAFAACRRLRSGSAAAQFWVGHNSPLSDLRQQPAIPLPPTLTCFAFSFTQQVLERLFARHGAGPALRAEIHRDFARHEQPPLGNGVVFRGFSYAVDLSSMVRVDGQSVCWAASPCSSHHEQQQPQTLFRSRVGSMERTAVLSEADLDAPVSALRVCSCAFSEL